MDKSHKDTRRDDRGGRLKAFSTVERGSRFTWRGRPYCKIGEVSLPDQFGTLHQYNAGAPLETLTESTGVIVNVPQEDKVEVT